MSFAALGPISFSVIASPTAVETEDGWHFAEINLVETKPTLQWVGDELRRVRFSLFLHQMFADPKADLAALKDLADQHQAVPFVMGNGDLIGNFVIIGIRKTDEWMSDQGDPIALSAEVQLLEWSGEMPAGAPDQAATTTVGIEGSSGSGATAIFVYGSGLGQPTPDLYYEEVAISTILRSA